MNPDQMPNLDQAQSAIFIEERNGKPIAHGFTRKAMPAVLSMNNSAENQATNTKWVTSHGALIAEAVNNNAAAILMCRLAKQRAFLLVTLGTENWLEIKEARVHFLSEVYTHPVTRGNKNFIAKVEHYDIKEHVVFYLHHPKTYFFGVAEKQF